MTFFEGDWRATEIINFWLDQRNSSSTALALISPPPPIEHGIFASQDEQAELEVGLVAVLAGGDHSVDAEEEMLVTVSGAINPLDSTAQDEPDDQEMTNVDEGDVSPLQIINHILQAEPESSSNEEEAHHCDRPDEGIEAVPGLVTTDVSQSRQVIEQDVSQDLLAEQNLIVEQDLTFDHASVQQDPPVAPNTIFQQEIVAEQDQPVEPVPAVHQDADTAANPSPIPGPHPGQNPWECALQTLYTPRALASGVHNILAPHLSPQARRRRHDDGQRGVNIRASFMLGAETGDIFDLDMYVDEGGIVEETLKGPREEGERFWEKLERRLWF